MGRRNVRPEDGDVTKLPKWAQWRIEHAETAARRATERFAELGRVLGSLEDLPRGHISYGNWEREIEIPGGDKITFHFGDGMEIQVRFNDDNTEIYLQASTTLELHPQSSNTLGVSMERDRVREKLAEARASETARNILLRPREHDGSYRRPKKS